MRVSLQRVLIALVVAVLLVALVPSGVLLDRQLVIALELRARAELSSAQLILEDRFANQAGARMMHAREIALSPRFSAALQRGDSAVAIADASAMTSAFVGELPAVIKADGTVWAGPTLPTATLAATREGGMPVHVVPHDGALVTVALAPVMTNGTWVGAAGT